MIQVSIPSFRGCARGETKNLREREREQFLGAGEKQEANWLLLLLLLKRRRCGREGENK